MDVTVTRMMISPSGVEHQYNKFCDWALACRDVAPNNDDQEEVKPVAKLNHLAADEELGLGDPLTCTEDHNHPPKRIVKELVVVEEGDAPPRASALNEARDLITGDRNNQYGPPTQDFKRTADLLNALGYARVDANEEVHDIVPSDVALIIAQVKVSRLMHSRGKRDSWVDLAGYAACGYECATEEEKDA